MAKKLKVGWFSFSCSEDSTIIFTELLNDHYLEWKNLIDFRSILVMQKKSEIHNLDVAFIEGAITSSEQEEKLKTIRQNSKKLVAVGSCAVIGMPSSQRNLFDEKLNQEIAEILIRFQYSAKVRKVSELVKVDDTVPGCPMNEKVFLDLVNKYLQEFGVSRA
ncbi:hypothetical protein A3D78_02055 [Candidatus Gottesmanbacteria bacterium RIFCSPHIGHO2_02_FULL_39_14]|uniref:NADH:ubiquinone oxidoreductase-like 20kDa subunit domain-containing protein n=1 Tax=Candidatus Gottesmanbacteria bacterium RIFCSPHIGHO2_02_FULL_39_14 TaxID=1798383 RepID=A0A1F6A3C1_9BACT|nr:MAG: hypothetical protein A3D78_02055 [Candidatus Gottesmanbacteria bacterium RIFCSPHIGHO2_02_FULL_39_14]